MSVLFTVWSPLSFSLVGEVKLGILGQTGEKNNRGEGKR